MAIHIYPPGIGHAYLYLYIVNIFDIYIDVRIAAWRILVLIENLIYPRDMILHVSCYSRGMPELQMNSFSA